MYSDKEEALTGPSAFKFMYRTALFFCLVFFGSNRSAQAQIQYEYRVEYFDASDGLPSSAVTSIAVDSSGFLWVGTSNGLARFDGYSFESYIPQSGDSTSISGRAIASIHVDSNGRIWAGGGLFRPRGLNRFDPVTEAFSRYLHDPQNAHSLVADGVKVITSSREYPNRIWVGANGAKHGVSSLDVDKGVFENYMADSGLSSMIIDMAIDDSGWLWVLDYDGGLNRLNTEVSSFETFYPELKLRSRNGGTLYIDRSGRLWMGSRAALSLFDPTTKTFTSYFPNPGELNHSSNLINAILEDQAGTLWIGTSNGIYTFDRIRKVFSRFHFQFEPTSSILTLYEDENGLIWVGGEGGLMKIERWEKAFQDFDKQDGKFSELPIVDGPVLQDHKGHLWIGNRDGLFQLNRDTGEITHYPEQWIISLFEKDGVLWAGTNKTHICAAGEILRMDLEEPGHIESFKDAPADSSSINIGCVNKPIEDHSGNIWIPLWSGGVDLLDSKTARFRHFTRESHGLGDDRTLRVYEAPSEPGTIWVGTESGLSRFDTNAEQFINYHDDRLKRVMMIHEDRLGRFWVATAHNGLHLFDRQTGLVVRSLTSRDGLANDSVYSIYEDSIGFLWLGTDHGLSRLDTETITFENFYQEDGLPGVKFGEYGHFQSSRGELFFSVSGKLVSFIPEDFDRQRIKPEIALTELRIDERIVEISNNSPLKKSIRYTGEVTLSHDQNDVGFEYVGVQLVNPDRTRYRYRLEGHDENWIDAGTQRTARYTNLSPGGYTFKVAARNGNSRWDEVTLKLNILPPWWRTWWAYAIYGVLIATVFIMADRFQRKRLIAKERLRAEREKARAIESTNNELQRALKHLTETQDQLIHTEKMASLGQLTAGIAHEIKNPLNFVNNFSTLSVGMLEELQAWIEEQDGMEEAEVRELIETLTMNAAKINEHGRRADGIIRSMLEHSCTGRGERRTVDINKLVDEYVNLAYHGVRAREDGFEVDLNREYDEVIGDIEIYPQEIGRVLINLLDNAYYTVNEKGLSTNGHYEPTVWVSTLQMADHVEVRIRDNGEGISEDLREKIFEPFYTTKPTGSGTGLGLSLSHDIVVKGHGGELLVESIKGKGATFIVRLPHKNSLD